MRKSKELSLNFTQKPFCILSIDGGGVRVDDEKVEGYERIINPDTPTVVQVGRRKFVEARRK